MKLLFLFVFSLVLQPLLHSDKILWEEGRKLTWEDFRGKPVQNAGFVANTTTGIKFEYSHTTVDGEVKLAYSTVSFFDPKTSWYIRGKVTQNILNHEQAHFDISELHARMLRKKIDSTQFSKRIKTEIQTIYYKVEADRKAMQKKFDAETDHSRKIEEEIKWEKRIAQYLAEYESWK